MTRGPALALAVAPASRRSSIAYRVALAFGGSWLVAGLAQFEVHLPFTPVPVTGQTLGVLVVGASLGSTLGAASLALYLAQGAAGLPFFSGGEGGVSVLATSSPTAGYLWGFVIVAYAVGLLAERGWDRSPGPALGAMLVGEVLLYLVGVPWLALAIDVSLAEAVRLGLTPFIVADAWKALVAALLLPAAWRLVRHDDRGGG
jgi:biotin transport system substrate-specific component